MKDNVPRRIVLGITGGVAAYKAAELARLLMKDGAEVQVVMTESAGRFVGPATFQALTGRPVFTDMWDGRGGNAMGHIEISRPAQAIVVAPATANFIAKLAHGLADDLLSTMCLAREPSRATGSPVASRPTRRTRAAEVARRSRSRKSPRSPATGTCR